MLKAIFFDLGCTLWDDYPAELHQWRITSRLLEKYGVQTTPAYLERLAHDVIDTYCPSLTRSMAWRLLKGDAGSYWKLFAELKEELLQTYRDPAEFIRLNPLFPGVPQLLAQLAERYPLAVVSQHFTEAKHWLEVHGIAKYFKFTALSMHEELYKPDPRLFLTACTALGVEPAQVMMVGDRLDNDIWPANRLRMVSVRVLGEPYRHQQPRYHLDVPQFTIERVTELPQVLASLDAAPVG
jgi:HAD superfamily hydrolase (TIGR01549 family)